jgi:hypothetical protein
MHAVAYDVSTRCNLLGHKNSVQKVRYEFGGPWGTGLMMIGFPAFMVWLWLSITFTAGVPFFSTSPATIGAAWGYIVANASPTWSGALFYFVYTVWTWALAQCVPELVSLL